MNEISPLRQCVISSSNTFTLDVKLSGALSFKHDESDNFYTFKTEMKQFHIEAVTSAGYNEDAVHAYRQNISKVLCVNAHTTRPALKF